MADEIGSDDDGEAEQDEMLIEYAGEVVPNLGKALGPQEFAHHFPHLLPLFANKTVGCVFVSMWKRGQTRELFFF